MTGPAPSRLQIAHETGRITRSTRRRGLPRALLLAGVGLVGACAPAQGEVLVERLRECEILSDGELGPYALSGFYAPDACYERCLAEASCPDLTASLCRAELELLLRCDQRCAFACDDGTLLGPDRVCDGFRACAGGEDEEGCDFPLTCTDGTRVRGARCDGAWNCPDGSDEAGCPATSGFTSCADGSASYASWQRCDGASSCANGEDEVGCPTFGCADSTTITWRIGGVSARCDGWTQCRDGSDEAGCARLTYMCSP